MKVSENSGKITTSFQVSHCFSFFCSQMDMYPFLSQLGYQSNQPYSKGPGTCQMESPKRNKKPRLQVVIGLSPTILIPGSLKLFFPVVTFLPSFLIKSINQLVHLIEYATISADLNLTK